MPLVSKNFSDIITFTRASTATYFDSAGVLQTAAIDAPRFDYNPATLAAQGLLIEEQRTNGIRNNTMQGAVAGTPGTLPTNWGSVLGTISANVVGTGLENGIIYIDVQFVGTTNSTTGSLYFETANGVAAVSGQSWSHTCYIRQVAGATTNITSFRLGEIGYTSGGATTTTDNLLNTNFSSTLNATSISANRQSVSGALADATTAFLRPRLVFNWNNGAAIDITLRIGLPQLEQGAFATSVIPTTTTALTRSADVASVNTLSPWFNASASTLYLEFVWEGLKSTSGQAYAQFDDGSTNNRIVAAAGSSNANIMTTTSGGTSDGSAATPATVFAANTIYKTALALAANDLQSFVNGTAGTADTTVTLPVGLTNFKLGASLSATANVWLRRVTYYPRRLSQAEGIAITA